MTSSEPAPPTLTYKEEALVIMREWQADTAQDRSVSPTEDNGATLYRINQVIYMLEAV